MIMIYKRVNCFTNMIISNILNVLLIVGRYHFLPSLDPRNSEFD